MGAPRLQVTGALRRDAANSRPLCDLEKLTCSARVAAAAPNSGEWAHWGPPQASVGRPTMREERGLPTDIAAARKRLVLVAATATARRRRWRQQARS